MEMFMRLHHYLCLAAMLIATSVYAAPTVLLDKNLSKADEVIDFAGRGRVSIPIDTASDAPQYYRLSIESRDTTRTPVSLSFRTSATPARALWSASLDPNEILTRREFVFQLDPHAEHTSFVIMTAQPGTLELGHITLARESRDDLIAQIKQDHPDGDQRQNLCRNSTFPLGIQSGWGIDREHDDAQMEVRADETVIGPSGSPAMKLSVADFMRTEVAPVDIPWPFMNHTASLYVRGKGHLALVVLADGRQLGALDADVNDDDWKRLSLKFTPAMLAETHQLQLVTSGTIWIDAMQIEPGETATEYHPAMPCEVSLAVSKSETSTPRIQFIDEPATVDFAVTGKFAGAILKSKVVNLYGEEKSLADVKLGDDFLRRGRLNYDVFPDRPFGQFRVEAWVEDSSGNRISPFNEIVVTRIRRPRHWNEDAPDSPFGVHMASISRHLLLCKAIGINWTRLHDAGCAYTCWAFVEPNKGQWTFHDADIARYREHHIEILGMLGTAPPWATGVPAKPNGPEYWDRWLEPKDNADYANYVRVMTSRYKDTIRYWDVWNEPWGKFWSKWDTSTTKPVRSPTAADDFARLQTAAFDAAKKVDPTLMITGIDTMGGNVGERWTKPLVDLGALSTCDIYDYHFYNTEMNGFPHDAADRTFDDSWSPAIDHFGGKLDKPVWMSEGNGANHMITRGFYHYTLPSSVPSEDFLRLCDYQSRYMTRVLAQGVKKLFLYGINVGGEWRAGPGEFQCLVNDDAFAHPEAAAHSALAYELEDTHFVKQLDPGDGIHAYLFTGNGRSVAVILSEAKFAKYVLPHPNDGLARDLFGNDVKVGELFRGTTVFVSSPTDVETLVKQL